MKILLDTNFVITATKNKLDFTSLANELVDEKIDWIIPQDVLNELGNIKDRKGTREKDKAAAKLAFDIIQNISPEIVDLPGKNPNVDIKIVNYILDKDIILATMDKDLKSRVKNKILTVRGKKNLELI
jgi:rRNA-processing protein FCF1